MPIGSRFHYKSPEEIEIIRKNCLLVSATLAEVATHIKPGVTGLQFRRNSRNLYRDHGAEPAFKGYPGSVFDFPGYLVYFFQ